MKIMSLFLAFLYMSTGYVHAGESWAPKADKLGHFAGGFAIGVTVTVGFKWSGGTAKQSARVGFLVGGAEGIRKEYLDLYSNQNAKAWGLPPVHSVSAADFAYTVAGAALGSYLTYKFMDHR